MLGGKETKKLGQNAPEVLTTQTNYLDVQLLQDLTENTKKNR